MKCLVCGQECFDSQYPETVFHQGNAHICEECSIDWNDAGDHRFPETYRDTETGEIVTTNDLWSIWAETPDLWPEYGHQFGQYINACMTRQGGTLE